MPNGDDQLSGEDLTALMQVRAKLGAEDPRGVRLDAFIKNQLASYAPPTTGQQPIPPGLQGAPTAKAIQYSMGGMPQFVDVPAADQAKFEAAGRKGAATGAKAGMAALAVPSIVAAPAAAGASIATGYVGGKAAKYGAKKGAEALGASPDTQAMVGDVAEFGGQLLGGYGGARGMGALQDAYSGAAIRARAAQTLSNIQDVAGKVAVDTSPISKPLLELF